MKTKNIKKMLIAESDSFVKPLNNKILEIPLEAKKEIVLSKQNFWQRNRIAIASICSVFVILILAISMLFSNINLDKSNLTSYIVEINPSVCITTNQLNQVVSICSLNDDGDTLLLDSSFDNVVGASLENCVKSIISVSNTNGIFNSYGDGKIKLFAINNSQSFALNKAQDVQSIINFELQEHGFDIGIEFNSMSIKDFKYKLGIESQFNDMDKMENDIVGHDEFFDPSHNPPPPPEVFRLPDSVQN